MQSTWIELVVFANLQQLEWHLFEPAESQPRMEQMRLKTRREKVREEGIDNYLQVQFGKTHNEKSKRVLFKKLLGQLSTSF